MIADDSLLDDPEAIDAADPGGMLRAVATSGAQVRVSAAASAEAGVERLADAGRPRAIVVTGMGGSGIAGDVLRAVTGTSCSLPIHTVRGYALPGWVSAVDLVAAVSCSGTTEETLSVADMAVHRGARLLTVGAAGSPLAELAARAHGVHVPVDAASRPPRANIWALSVPLLAAVDALGVYSVPAEARAGVADLLDAVSERCGPITPTIDNPAKALALEVAGTLPMVWGTSDLAAVVAYRFACQLAENAKYPGVHGELPEAGHNQVVAFDGPYAGVSPDDLFRDRVEEPEPAATRLRLVLLRDSDEHAHVAARREICHRLAADKGIPVSEVVAEATHPLERLASLVARTDFASVYLALALGIDPTPIPPITELKERIAR